MKRNKHQQQGDLEDLHVWHSEGVQREAGRQDDDSKHHDVLREHHAALSGEGVGRCVVNRRDGSRTACADRWLRAQSVTDSNPANPQKHGKNNTPRGVLGARI